MRNTLIHMIELALRWHVAISMFVYGIAKTVQFDATAENHAPVNSLTGQQLMWAFYGYSLTYAKFLGVVEMAGAVLLLFRRTTLLGCLVVTTVLVNVIVQDLVYGVLEGALRAAIIYQALTVVILLINWQRVTAVWKAFTSPVQTTSALRWYWLALGAAAVLACTLFLEHMVTHWIFPS